ncbi:MAG: hypothetical protein KBG00_10555 [Rhodoferax sp.]|jgi:hypothetical protein|uniref:DUF7694 domain-containing protein n=1 Tax=Rhodoferax sp. TaxID=50421 RepID=UPI001B69EEB1|nr:hypothetical protein [Rhodoferax sp.]MBP9149209.1 hypothetical protein [Rhodoferax sp.]MBP9736160.1 hypothetical protein [Rhodoferax sp.]
MNREQRRTAAKHMAAESAKFEAHLTIVPQSEYPAAPPPGMYQVLRSKDYLVQCYRHQSPLVLCRLSVNRVGVDSKGGWTQDIPWVDLQRLKNEAGFCDSDAVEVYPADKDVINVANMRHLWIMALPLDFAWRKA